jgi:hypothetical protein
MECRPPHVPMTIHIVPCEAKARIMNAEGRSHIRHQRYHPPPFHSKTRRPLRLPASRVRCAGLRPFVTRKPHAADEPVPPPWTRPAPRPPGAQEG